MRAFQKGLAISFAVLNLLVIVAIWLNGSGALVVASQPGSTLIAFGRLFGLLGAFGILVQLALVGRITWIERLFGFDKLNRVHRFLGYSLALFFLGHPLLLIWGYSIQSELPFWSQFLQFVGSSDDLFKAFLGFLLLVFIITFALPPIRHRVRYETWYFTHLLIYVAIALLFGHQINGGDFVNVGIVRYWYLLNFGIFGVFFLFRFVRPLYRSAYHQFRIEKVVSESAAVSSLYIVGRHMDKFKFRAGQYANINILAQGFWTSHPFSISVAPNGQHLRFSIKAVGDFTDRIKLVPPGTRLLVDGPLGAFTTLESRTGKYFFIAGGIGITPIRAMIEELSGSSADMVLLYANKTPADMVFAAELQKFSCPVRFIYSAATVPGALEGHVDRIKILEVAPDVTTRDIYLCGPAPMMRAVVAELRALGVPARQIHYERFGY